MFMLDVVLIWGHHFRHNTHKAAIILVIACFIYIFMSLMLCFLVFTAVLMGWYMGLYIHAGHCISKCFVFYKIIIYMYSN